MNANDFAKMATTEVQRKNLHETRQYEDITAMFSKKAGDLIEGSTPCPKR